MPGDIYEFSNRIRRIYVAPYIVHRVGDLQTTPLTFDATTLLKKYRTERGLDHTSIIIMPHARYQLSCMIVSREAAYY